MEVYQRLGQDAEEIVAIHMSSTLSPMWSQSRKAADMMMGRYRIRVMDSQTTSMGLGMLAELPHRPPTKAPTSMKSPASSTGRSPTST